MCQTILSTSCMGNIGFLSLRFTHLVRRLNQESGSGNELVERMAKSNNNNNNNNNKNKNNKHDDDDFSQSTAKLVGR